MIREMTMDEALEIVGGEDDFGISLCGPEQGLKIVTPAGSLGFSAQSCLSQSGQISNQYSVDSPLVQYK